MVFNYKLCAMNLPEKHDRIANNQYTVVASLVLMLPSGPTNVLSFTLGTKHDKRNKHRKYTSRGQTFKIEMIKHRINQMT